ncbi:hypothetical protein Tco_0669383, partial [Tanacetum coccineum]
SMIGSLMYLTASRPGIMFAVCACASDYGGASLDRKSTIVGCQFLGRRLISCQCKKQTIVANSTTEAEYVAAANCFKNHVYHSRTKPPWRIQNHLIWDCYEKKIAIDVIKIHTDANVADLLTKGFDVTRFKFLVLGLLVWLILPGLHLVLSGLVCAAQKYFTMEMMFGFGKKMLLGLVLKAINGSRQIWCCQANLMLPDKFGAARQIWCCQANLVLPGKIVEDKSSGDKGGNVEELVSNARSEVSTARPDIDAARQEDSVVEPRNPSITTNQILTFDKPLPTIDPKDKGKWVLKESPVKKIKRSDLDAYQIAKDAEIARLVHEKELAEIEREREEIQRQDKASVDYIASLYDEVQAKMDASKELATRLQMEEREREMYTIEERSKLLEEFFKRGRSYLLKKELLLGEKMIDKMKKAAGMDEEEVPEETESTKVEVKKVKTEENISEDEEIDYVVSGHEVIQLLNGKSCILYILNRIWILMDFYRVFSRAEGESGTGENSSRYYPRLSEMVSRFLTAWTSLMLP